MLQWVRFFALTYFHISCWNEASHCHCGRCPKLTLLEAMIQRYSKHLESAAIQFPCEASRDKGAFCCACLIFWVSGPPVLAIEDGRTSEMRRLETDYGTLRNWLTNQQIPAGLSILSGNMLTLVVQLVRLNHLALGFPQFLVNAWRREADLLPHSKDEFIAQVGAKTCKHHLVGQFLSIMASLCFYTIFSTFCHSEHLLGYKRVCVTHGQGSRRT